MTKRLPNPTLLLKKLLLLAGSLRRVQRQVRTGKTFSVLQSSSATRVRATGDPIAAHRPENSALTSGGSKSIRYVAVQQSLTQTKGRKMSEKSEADVEAWALKDEERLVQLDTEGLRQMGADLPAGLEETLLVLAGGTTSQRT